MTIQIERGKLWGKNGNLILSVNRAELPREFGSGNTIDLDGRRYRVTAMSNNMINSTMVNLYLETFPRRSQDKWNQGDVFLITGPGSEEVVGHAPSFEEAIELARELNGMLDKVDPDGDGHYGVSSIRPAAERVAHCKEIGFLF